MSASLKSVALAGCVAALLFQWRVTAQDDSLGREAQAILAESCYGCHGPGQQMGGLRLDTGAQQSRHSRHSADSLLIKRITGADGLARMPMGAPALSADKIATLAKWIDAGAVLPAPARHWAFIPPVRPAVPSASRADWVRNPIDAFLLARLDREGLKPSPEADRATLLRRVSLDLTGLPPTPAELDAFLADRSPNAYEKQVDRLLASPHYGERWARIWLDAARYADSNGYEKDAPRFVWFYRDWVINALNRDCRTTSSSSTRSPAICCPTPRRIRTSPPASCATPWSTRRAASIPSSSAWKPCSTAWTPSARESSASPFSAPSATTINTIR